MPHSEHRNKKRNKRLSTISQKGVTSVKSTPTKATPLSTTKESTESSSELNERIRCRAYELYEVRGREMVMIWTTGSKQSWT